MINNIRISTTMSKEFMELSKTHKIKRSQALAVGVSLLLAEKGLQEYDNNLTIVRRLNLYHAELEKKNKEIEELLNKIKGVQA